MAIELTENERIDEVNEHLSLIQRKDGLVFGTDALLLAAYVARHAPRAAEFGAGCGIVSLLLLRRDKAKHVTAVEVQEDYARLTARNAELNGLSDRLTAAACDLRAFSEAHREAFDLIVANPPYMKADSGYMCREDAKTVARHEIHGDIKEWCSAAARSLRYGGYFVAVYRPDRLTDLLCAMREAALEPKRMTFVQADAATAPSMVLVLCKRGGASGVTLTRPLLLHTDKAHTSPSDDMRHILDFGSFPKDFFESPKKRKESV